MSPTLSTILLTVQVAGVATLLVTPPACAVAYLLARRRFWGSRMLSTALSLPLVLPPTAVGYILLRLLSVDSPVGQALAALHVQILLTWRGAVLAASVMALPLVVRTARVAFEGVDPRLEQLDRTLGHSNLRVLLRTTLPLARPGLISATVLGFTRAVGEFGATVTLAGNIPGHTQTLAGAIFSAQAAGNASEAWALLSFALVVGAAALYWSETLTPRVS